MYSRSLAPKNNVLFAYTFLYECATRTRATMPLANLGLSYLLRRHLVRRPKNMSPRPDTHHLAYYFSKI